MSEYSKVLSRLQMQCSRREYCSRDILQKAAKALDGDTDAAERILEELRKERFVDDLRYAAAFAREKSRLTGWGPVKISYALAAKGIDKATVRAALGEIDGGEASRRMRSVLEAKWKVLRDDPQGKFKLLKFGLSRGYEYEDLAPAVETLLKSAADSVASEE
ncbi:MAG: regulatory protein RecX [Candidatus Cryptobacteroides sp.]